MAVGERVTYRSVLANREFTAILLSQTLSVLGDQLARIAIAVLVYERTGSSFAASASYAVSYLTYMLGSPLLSALPDRYPRLTVMVVCDVLRAPLVLALCFDDVPLWAFFAVLGVVGALAPPFDSARSALQPDVLPGDAYVIGNALMTFALQLGQVAGFAAGGALVALTSVRGALGLDAATFLLSAGVLLLAVNQRLAAQDPSGRASLARDTAAGVQLVARSPELRGLLGLAVLGAATVIAPEGLALPVAADLGHGSTAAGFLTASVPAGFLIGGLLVLRTPAAQRTALLPRLALASCLPLILTPLVDELGVVLALWFLAGAGSSLNLIASAAYVQACPQHFRARAYGVAVTCLYAAQGLVLLAGGALTSLVSPSAAVAAVAAVALLTLGITRVAGSPQRSPAQGNAEIVRMTTQ